MTMVNGQGMSGITPCQLKIDPGRIADLAPALMDKLSRNVLFEDA